MFQLLPYNSEFLLFVGPVTNTLAVLDDHNDRYIISIASFEKRLWVRLKRDEGQFLKQNQLPGSRPELSTAIQTTGNKPWAIELPAS